MRPTPRCLLLFAAAFPAAALPVLVDPGLWTAWLIQVALSVLLAGLDLILALPARRLDVDLAVPPTLFIGEPGHADVTLRMRARFPETTVDVLADLHGDLLPQPIRQAVVSEEAPTTVRIPLVAVRRGTVAFERLWLRWTGPLGLMQRQVVREEDVEIAVVPDIGAVRRAALQFALSRDTRVGQKSMRLVGEGSEFEAMREYARGLDHRAISWKASARHHKLICQEFRTERNHQVIVAFDTGRLMAEPLGGIPKLDHAIHTGLVLAYTGLRTGDRVGLFAFDEQVRAHAAPRGGVRDFPRLQHVTAGLDTTTSETNFTLGFAELATRLKRRSLVVVLTDFIDTTTAELMIDNAGRLARRHLVVFVTLRNVHLDAAVAEPPQSTGALYRSVVANDFVRERDLVLRRLEQRGIFTIDAVPEAVSSELLNRYLSIKRRELV